MTEVGKGGAWRKKIVKWMVQPRRWGEVLLVWLCIKPRQEKQHERQVGWSPMKDSWSAADFLEFRRKDSQPGSKNHPKTVKFIAGFWEQKKTKNATLKKYIYQGDAATFQPEAGFYSRWAKRCPCIHKKKHNDWQENGLSLKEQETASRGESPGPQGIRATFNTV